MKKLKHGDVVMLNSGGVLMTVSSVINEGKFVYCKWFLDGKYHEDRFYAPMVSKVGLLNKLKRVVWT